mmetsp:Transcript_27899/g.99261  ORF Transcript_27899/g.99261 Transcript_27899/m.99261 type:complete len:201 (+) Transcript_27899:235-837(+)
MPLPRARRRARARPIPPGHARPPLRRHGRRPRRRQLESAAVSRAAALLGRGDDGRGLAVLVRRCTRARRGRRCQGGRADAGVGESGCDRPEQRGLPSSRRAPAKRRAGDERRRRRGRFEARRRARPRGAPRLGAAAVLQRPGGARRSCADRGDEHAAAAQAARPRGGDGAAVGAAGRRGRLRGRQPLGRAIARRSCRGRF